MCNAACYYEGYICGLCLWLDNFVVGRRCSAAVDDDRDGWVLYDGDVEPDLSVRWPGSCHTKSPLRTNEPRSLRSLELWIPRLCCRRSRLPGSDLFGATRLYDARTRQLSTRDTTVSRRSHLICTTHLQLCHRSASFVYSTQLLLIIL